MFCAKCGTQVDDAATFCRACGTALGESATPTTPKRGGLWIGWLVVLAGIGVSLTPARALPVEAARFVGFVLLWIGFSIVFPGSSRIVRMGKAVVGALIVSAPTFYLRSVAQDVNASHAAQDVALDMLVSDYTANEVAADQHYKGQWVRTSGVLTSVSKDIAGSPFVLVGTGSDTELRQVQCSLSTSAVTVAARLSPGMPVTVQGRVNGLLMNVQLGDCTFVAESNGLAHATTNAIPVDQQKQSATETVAAITAASSAPATVRLEICRARYR